MGVWGGWSPANREASKPTSRRGLRGRRPPGKNLFILFLQLNQVGIGGKAVTGGMAVQSLKTLFVPRPALAGACAGIVFSVYRYRYRCMHVYVFNACYRHVDAF